MKLTEVVSAVHVSIVSRLQRWKCTKYEAKKKLSDIKVIVDSVVVRTSRQIIKPRKIMHYGVIPN